MAAGTHPYHHGDLRRALVDAAVGLIEEVGPAAMTLREVARRAGVSHASVTYHFGDKAGLLTVLAADGYRMLGDTLREAHRSRHSFLEVGVAYVRFAVTHHAYFEAMFQPELHRRDDAELRAAKAATSTLLYGTDHPDDGQRAAGVAAWAIVHGIAALWLTGNLPEELGHDPEEITRIVAGHLRVGGR
ncbi:MULTISPECIES: TetR/AcrR family transcriptional regulator [unclassified Pseudofrankia]|uniref:TetR/AcrR family transcriptional regulator n=1 Tax=unclassified Pseudofrankia TaxID=2994372 RepID=UPI0008D9A776|nr:MULTISPECIES: TetR family transcriptional regulator [unclassified Pseudofrankia]MDT3444553.1 TetR family transcriptional regulator [Pseudofrankia sp. BMG5.37]OHV56422.1 TetR family transcriptional regulator [Pseudofrankia sp. BMG5.36]